jgi:hypothetical protein
MTTLTGPAPAAAAHRAVPWTRLAWVSWRQRRVALMTAAILLGAFGLYLLIMGLRIRGAYAAVASCHPADSARCQDLLFGFNLTYYRNFGAPVIQAIGGPQMISAFLIFLPALLGAFAGAPVLARELETGTFRFAWTQGCGRLRWSLAQLVLPAIALTAAAGAFSVLFSWYIQPFIADGQLSLQQPYQFPLHGVAYAAWTLVAFAIAAFAGVVIRRTVPALAAALAAWVGLAVATSAFLRAHYETPLRASGGVPHAGPSWLYSNWVISSWTTGPGGRVVSPAAFANVVPLSVQNSPNQAVEANWMRLHHYTQWWSYQPAGRYWHFQLIEGGWLLALSVVLIAATIWLVRRRAA